MTDDVVSLDELQRRQEERLNKRATPERERSAAEITKEREELLKMKLKHDQNKAEHIADGIVKGIRAKLAEANRKDYRVFVEKTLIPEYHKLLVNMAYQSLALKGAMESALLPPADLFEEPTPEDAPESIS